MSNGTTGKANIGVVGLAVMGANLARNLAGREGNTVAVFNRSPERTRSFDGRPRSRRELLVGHRGDRLDRQPADPRHVEMHVVHR